MAVTEDRRRRASISALAALLERQPPEVAERLVTAVQVIDAHEPLDLELGGPAPSDEEYLAAVARSLATEQELRERALRGALTRAEAAKRLGVTPQAVTNKLESGLLLGLREGREWRLPEWQFDGAARDGVLPGAGRLASVFLGGVLVLGDWVEREQIDLDGRTPRAALRAGEVERVVGLAESLTAAGW